MNNGFESVVHVPKAAPLLTREIVVPVRAHMVIEKKNLNDFISLLSPFGEDFK